MALYDEYPGLFYHRVEGSAVDTMTAVRGAYISLAELVCDLAPHSRARSLAMTSLEDSLMRAIQSLAIEHGKSN